MRECLVLALLLFCGVPRVLASVRMSAIFGDHMVLQQGATLPIWGMADPGEHIVVQFAGRHGETMADGAGRWRITLRPVPPSFAPEVLVIQGSERIEIRDVLVGDVWIAAGEGNMESPLSSSPIGKSGYGHTPDEGLRFFTVPIQAAKISDSLGSGHWVVCEPAVADSCSAIAYVFARDLRSTRHLPVGMIVCAVPDSPIASWISLRGIKESPSLVPQLPLLGKGILPLCNNDSRVSGSAGLGREMPSVLFNAMVAPMVPYAITGAIWYQGESDEGSAALAYRRFFPRLIRDWRRHWGQGPFPFLFASLSGFGAEGGPPVESFLGADGQPRRGWPWIREGQVAALALPYTGMAVTTDLGIPGEKLIPESLQAGRRLALLARHRAYGEEIVDSGPLFRSMRAEGNKLRLQFDSKGSGLLLGIPHRLTQQGDRPRSVDPKLSGFAIAGADQRWHPATGRIEGEGSKQSVLLWSDAVVRPVAVRYDWKGFPEGNLYNRNGLPAPPFRTDLDQPR